MSTAADRSAAPLPPPEPAPPTPVTATPAAVSTAVPGAAGDGCPSCGAPLAADQRYCLECGHRRGDPRLPIMDAVVFMDAVNRQAAPPPPPPPPAQEKRSGLSANAAMVAGIGTLVLAIGVGVLIGRGGEHGTNTAAATPQIIKVGGGETETASTETAAEEAAKASKSKAKNASAKEPDSGNEAASADVLKPAADVKLPPPTVQKGGKCDAGSAGCSSGGEFTGEFFGE